MKEYEIIVETFDRLAESYSITGGMEEVNRLLLAPVIKEWKGRLLDVGCGAGALIEKYYDPGRTEIHTVDFSEKMIEETSLRLRHAIGTSIFPVRALAQSLPFQRDSFDCALSVNTLHNMPAWEDISAAISEIARVVRPHGVILLEFRNRDNPWRRHIAETYDRPDLPQKAFTINEVTAELKRIRLEIERVIPLTGDEEPDSFVMSALEELRRKCAEMVPGHAPRFAVVARKSPGFNSFLLESVAKQ